MITTTFEMSDRQHREMVTDYVSNCTYPQLAKLAKQILDELVNADDPALLQAVEKQVARLRKQQRKVFGE